MLRWAAGFFVLAIVAAIVGFAGIATGAADIAKVLFFVAVLVLALLLGKANGGRIRPRRATPQKEGVNS